MYLPVIQAHRAYQAEYRIRRADGAYRWFLDTATPRFLADGAFAGYVGIAMDVTDLKRNQEQLLAAQMYESVGMLVAGVAHRFNNLMGTIIAEADLAASELSPESQEYGSVKRINATAIRASEIVSLLMTYAGGGSGEVRGPVNLSHAVEEALRLFRATLLKNVALTVNLDTTLPPIYADVAHIRQIVMNLLTNAQESLPKMEGSIGVSTSCVTIQRGERPPWNRCRRANMSAWRLQIPAAGSRRRPVSGFLTRSIRPSLWVADWDSPRFRASFAAWEG